MPIIKSAKKRVKVSAKANARNSKTRAQLRETFKQFKRSLEIGKAADISKSQREAIQAIDIAAKKNVVHRNKAARKKSQLAKMAKAKGVKAQKVAKPAKAAAKKSVKK